MSPTMDVLIWLCMAVHLPITEAWSPRNALSSPSACSTRGFALPMNLFSDFGEMLTGGKLVDRTNLPYDTPLAGSSSARSSEPLVLAIQERPLSFSGEDFDAVEVSTNTRFARVRGAMLHLPGKDKMCVFDCSNGAHPVVDLDRKLVALTPTYELFRRDDGSKLGWIEKKVVALTDTFEVFLELQPGGFGLLKSAAFRLEGDFIERNFAMKNAKNDVVAKVSKSGILPQFDMMNHYEVRIAPGMDPFLVIACTCAIDEEFDEEHKERKRKEQER